jgi:Fic-DOC domain mobile mystery protein B
MKFLKISASGYGQPKMSDGTEPPGATGGEDLSGLLQKNLSDQRARHAAETDLIDLAYQKYIFRARPRETGSGWLTSDFLKKVHREMFGEIWDWAGKYRQEPRNIGIDWHKIPEHIGVLCGDFQYWDSSSAMAVSEVAARLQNHLTRIHPFSNGNGRHARLITDIFFHSRRMKPPRWPQIQLMTKGDQIRESYIKAMKDADREDYTGLMKFIEECRQKSAKENIT